MEVAGRAVKQEQEENSHNHGQAIVGTSVYVTKGETFKRQRGHEDPCPAAFITFSTIHESKYELCLCAMKKMGPNVSLVPQQLLQKRLPSMVLISNSQESFLFCSA